MSESLFPVTVTPGSVSTSGELPMAKEVAWDYETDRPIFRRGEPVIVSGLEAVRVWCWNALHTVRFRHEPHSWAYGNEMERLIGKPFAGDLKQAEAIRYFREALEPNPYVVSVDNVTVAFEDDHLTVSGTVKTIYGDTEVTANV